MCFLIVIALQGSIAHASSRCEYAYLQYSGLLSGFWSNTVLGNEHNKAIWCRQRESSGKTFYAASNRLEVLRQCGNVLLAAASLGPTIFLIINITHENDVEPALIAALIVSLTRIFLIVNSLSTLVYRALDYISEHARIKVLLGALASLRGRSIAVPAEAINVMINGITVSDLSQAKRLIAPYERGRFTITGANGSGKSTLLMHLKKEYGASCFILPTNYSDLIWEKDYRSLSSGERLVAQLTEIFQIEEIHFLLLDEWDANLDKENVKQIDEILSSLSTTKVIIEVRHRRSEA